MFNNVTEEFERPLHRSGCPVQWLQREKKKVQKKKTDKETIEMKPIRVRRTTKANENKAKKKFTTIQFFFLFQINKTKRTSACVLRFGLVHF